MAESLERLVENLQAEIRNLRAQVSSGRPTAPKDLSLISLISKWSGTEESVSVEEFLDSVESSAKIGNWSDFDKVQITALKLTEVAKVFYSSNPKLHSASISWENFKAKFLHRFRDLKSDRYRFMQLRTAKQQKDETATEFLDRCCSLAIKTVPKVEDSLLRKFHYDQAERMLLSTFIAGLSGNPGRQVRFQMPATAEMHFKLRLRCLRRKLRRKGI